MAKTHIRTRQASDPFNQRLYWLTVFFFVIFGVIIVRLGWLQIVSAKQYRDLAEQQHLVEKNLNQIRGEIKINDQFSGSPHTVATSVELDTVAALPFKIKQPEKIAKQIAAIIEVPESELVAKLADQSKKYLILRKRLPEDRKKQLEALRIDGIVFEPEIVRLYPEKSFLSQVLGYVGFKDNEKVGQYGLEQFFEIELKGQSGSLAQEKDPGGTWIFGGRRDIKPALDGINLLLTIDKSIQFKTESILKILFIIHQI